MGWEFAWYSGWLLCVYFPPPPLRLHFYFHCLLEMRKKKILQLIWIWIAYLLVETLLERTVKGMKEWKRVRSDYFGSVCRRGGICGMPWLWPISIKWAKYYCLYHYEITVNRLEAVFLMQWPSSRIRRSYSKALMKSRSFVMDCRSKIEYLNIYFNCSLGNGKYTL